MTSYRIQEANLTIPSEWSDQSLNIFKIPGGNGFHEGSFLISRDTLDTAKAFKDYFQLQLNKCQTQLPQFELKKNECFETQGTQCGWLEYCWHNGSIVLYIRQIFYAIGAKVLICTLTVSPADVAHHDATWRRVMNSLKLLPPPQDDAPDFPPKNP